MDRLVFTLGLIEMFPWPPWGLLLYVRFCLLVLNIEDREERTAFPDRSQRAELWLSRDASCPPISWESCLVPAALGPMSHRGESSKAEHVGKGQGSSLPSEFFTSCD